MSSYTSFSTWVILISKLMFLQGGLQFSPSLTKFASSLSDTYGLSHNLLSQLLNFSSKLAFSRAAPLL